MVINGILQGYSESGFVRISMPYDEANKTLVEKEIDDFVDRFTPELIKIL